MPVLLPEWPVEGDLIVSLEAVTDELERSMAEAWRIREANREALESGFSKNGSTKTGLRLAPE